MSHHPVALIEAPAARAEDLAAASFKAIVESAGDVVTLIDAEGIILYESPAFERVFGMKRNAMLGQNVLDFMHPDDRPRVVERFAAMIAGQVAEIQVVFRFRSGRGGWLWVESFVTNRLHDPEVAALLAISRDITQSRRLEMQFAQAELVAHFGCWRWETRTQETTCSPGLYALAGTSPEQEGPGNWIMRRLHPDDRDHVRAALHEAHRTGKPFSYRCRFWHEKLGYRMSWTDGEVELDAEGRVFALIGVCRDITERVRAEEALRASEEMYRLLADNASDVIGRFDRDKGFTFLSPAVRQVLGYEPEDCLGRTVLPRLYRLRDWDVFAERIWQSAQTAERTAMLSRARHKDGHDVWLETSAHAVRDPISGKVTEIVTVSRDVSERKRHEIELLRARDAAEAANQAKSQFLANMSHELRTPLNAIIGFSEVLKEQMFGPLGNPRYTEYVRDIFQSGVHLLDLINDILDMSKIEAGKYELRPEEVDLDEVVNSSLRLVQLRAREAALTIDRLLGTEPLPLVADRRALKQILVNLLSNAVKFTPAGGRITIAAEARADRIILRVSDTGIGILPEHLSRLGRPFEQVQSAAENQPQAGTGLGLALVNALVGLHGGRLHIDSAVGVGTVITVDLPANGPESAAKDGSTYSPTMPVEAPACK